MEKFITEFKEMEDGISTVSVFVFQIESGKLQETIDLLKGAGFKFTSIDAESIRAEFVGGYDSAWQAIERIQAEGFVWNQ